MLKQIQALTGLAFGIFVALHLLNTFLMPFGADAYDTAQAALRVGYQFPLLEILLLASVATHAGIGVAQLLRGPKPVTARGRWHRYSALFLLLVITGHVLAVRGPSAFYDVYPGFAGLAFSIDYLPYYFYPYYFLLGMAGTYHMLNGSVIALVRLRFLRSARATWLMPVSAAFGVAMVAALLALGGVFFDVGPVHESSFARLAARLTGIELP